MSSEMVRKHFILPKEVAAEFERVAGSRKQSEIVTGIIQDFLRRSADANFFLSGAGFLTAEDHPEWETAAGVNKWVRDLRAEEWESESSQLQAQQKSVDALSA